MSDHIRQQGQKMLSLVQNVREKNKERDKLLATLEVQGLVMLQGIDVAQVAAYGYESALDKRKVPVKIKFRFWGNMGEAAWRKANPVFNYLVMKDGTKVPIEPVPIG